jgi:uncharacterized protein (DUF362 family)
MKSTVSLVKSPYNGVGVKKNLLQVMNLAGFKPLSSVNSIALKLNLCYYWNSSTGQTTDPKLVEALIDFLKEKHGADVEKRTIEVNGQNLILKIPQTLLNSDLFINLPKLKVMRATHISCAMKNLFGAIAYPRKIVYHNALAETIVAANAILKPNLNIVDGLVALGHSPVRLNLLMAGENAFSIDWIAAQIMGFNPWRINFLKLAIKKQLGKPQEIVVVGEKMKTFSKVFPRENNFYSKAKIKMQFVLLKTYRRIVGDIIPPSLEDNA